MVFPAPEGSRFEEGAGEKLVGKSLPLQNDGSFSVGTINEAKVVHDGAGLLVKADFSSPIPNELLVDLARDTSIARLPEIPEPSG